MRKKRYIKKYNLKLDLLYPRTGLKALFISPLPETEIKEEQSRFNTQRTLGNSFLVAVRGKGGWRSSLIFSGFNTLGLRGCM